MAKCCGRPACKNWTVTKKIETQKKLRYPVDCDQQKSQNGRRDDFLQVSSGLDTIDKTDIQTIPFKHFTDKSGKAFHRKLTENNRDGSKTKVYSGRTV